MIAKLKAWIIPILGKLPKFRKSPREQQETGLPSDEEKTLKEEISTLAPLQESSEEEIKEETSFKPSFLQRTKTWLTTQLQKRKKNQPDSEPDTSEADATLVIQQVKNIDVPLGDEHENVQEESPSGKLADLKKLVFRQITRKVVWIPAVILAFLGFGVTVTVLVFNKLSAQERAFHNLQAQANKLKQENQALKDTRKTALVAAAKPPTVHLPLPAVSRTEDQASEQGNFQEGDCVLSDKTKVREALKSCIEAFNKSGN